MSPEVYSIVQGMFPLTALIMVMAMATLPWRVAYWLYPTSLDDK